MRHFVCSYYMHEAGQKFRAANKRVTSHPVATTQQVFPTAKHFLRLARRWGLLEPHTDKGAIADVIEQAVENSGRNTCRGLKTGSKISCHRHPALDCHHERSEGSVLWSIVAGLSRWEVLHATNKSRSLTPRGARDDKSSAILGSDNRQLTTDNCSSLPCRKPFEEAAAVPRRRLGSIGHSQSDVGHDVFKLAGRRQIDRLVQVVGGSVVAIVQPLLRRRFFRTPLACNPPSSPATALPA